MSSVSLRRSPRLAAKHTTPTTPVTSTLPTQTTVPVENKVEKTTQTVGTAKSWLKSPHSCNYCSAPAPLTKEEARDIFLNHIGESVNPDYKKECVVKLTQYIDDCDSVRGRTAKMVVATCLMRSILQLPTFLAAYPRFHKIILVKMEEFEGEGPCEDAVIDQAFRYAITDVLYVYGGDE